MHSLKWPTRQARTLRRRCARLSRPTTKQFELRLLAALSKVRGQYDFAANGTEGKYVALIYEFGHSENTRLWTGQCLKGDLGWLLGVAMLLHHDKLA